jgi:hypothetical protein
MNAVPLALIGFALAFMPAKGSHEAVIVFDQVALSSKQHGIEIIVDESGDKQLEVQVKIRDGVVRVEGEDLLGAKAVEMGSVRLITEPTHPGELGPGGLIGLGYVVSFEFGGTYDHGEGKGKEVLVKRVLRLHFSKEGFVRSEVAIPKGEFSNEWQFVEKEKGKAQEAASYTESSIRCPWTESISPNY